MSSRKRRKFRDAPFVFSFSGASRGVGGVECFLLFGARVELDAFVVEEGNLYEAGALAGLQRSCLLSQWLGLPALLVILPRRLPSTVNMADGL